MEPELVVAAAMWVGLLVYGAWLCIEDLARPPKNEDAAESPGKTEEKTEEETGSAEAVSLTGAGSTWSAERP